MISRYTLPEMGALWSEQTKFEVWLEVEILACEAWAKEGRMPADAVEEIRAKSTFTVERIDEIEKTTRHDVIAFLQSVEESIGPLAKYLHWGLTSSDVVDTAQNVRMQRAMDQIIEKAIALENLLREMARKYKLTIMMGRTHGMHSEPTTFGVKCLLWAEEMHRNVRRLKAARKTISFGKVSGAVGIYSHIPPAIEAYICEKLGLEPAPVSTQVIQRDRHAEYISAIAIAGTTLEKIALEIRHFQRPEFGELQEPFGRGQKGSSAMPHKKNPVTCEQICGLSRVLRSNVQTAMENVALWHERDISHSSAERVIIPDSCILIDYLLSKTHRVLDGLVVNEARMRENLDLTKGAVFSAKCLVLLMEKGVPRTTAYELVQRNALKSYDERIDFREVVRSDPEFMNHFSEEELDCELAWESYLKYVDDIFERVEGRK
jgi:adenylosuccinate lyase